MRTRGILTLRADTAATSELVLNRRRLDGE
jgi:hypothetical protein